MLKDPLSPLLCRKGFSSSMWVLVPIALLLLTAGACETTNSSVGTVQASVHGKVTTASNKPVEEATVVLRYHHDGCDSPDLDGTEEITNSGGEFQTVFFLAGSPPDKSSCFLASVDPPEGSGLATPEPKEFYADFRPNPPYDSVRVDFVLDSLSTN